MIVDFDSSWSEQQMLSWFEAYSTLLNCHFLIEERSRKTQVAENLREAASLLEASCGLLNAEELPELKTLAANLRLEAAKIQPPYSSPALPAK